MATLTNLIGCGQNKIVGTTQTLYVTLLPELTGWPMTRKEVVEAASGTPAFGDEKILDEPFDFSAAGTGLGFWRTIQILVDTGNFRNTLEGEIGGQAQKQRYDFFILGSGAVENAFVDCLVANAGCLIPMIKDKEGNHRVMANPDNPAYVEASEGGPGGERNGYQITLFTNLGVTDFIYDAATHGVDVTPNP